MKLSLTSGKEVEIFISHYHDHDSPPGVELWFPRNYKEFDEPVYVLQVNDSTNACIKFNGECFTGTSYRSPKDKEFNKKIGRKYAVAKALKNLTEFLDPEYGYVDSEILTVEDRRDIWNFILGRK